MRNSLFAHRLRETMREKNMKQIDIMREAEKRGIKLGKSHISQYVSGKTIPRENILKVLAEILEVDAAWLKGKSEETLSEKGDCFSKGESAKKVEKVYSFGKE